MWVLGTNITASIAEAAPTRAQKDSIKQISDFDITTMPRGAARRRLILVEAYGSLENEERTYNCLQNVSKRNSADNSEYDISEKSDFISRATLVNFNRLRTAGNA